MIKGSQFVINISGVKRECTCETSHQKKEINLMYVNQRLELGPQTENIRGEKLQ